MSLPRHPVASQEIPIPASRGAAGPSWLGDVISRSLVARSATRCVLCSRMTPAPSEMAMATSSVLGLWVSVPHLLLLSAERAIVLLSSSLYLSPISTRTRHHEERLHSSSYDRRSPQPSRHAL